ncbi:MAG: SRPBCC family protein [Cyanobacteria bacterium P01_H01_bin.15]
MSVIENSIEINASAIAVETCFTDLELMHRWLNPALRCEPVGSWSTELGSRSRFFVQLPLLSLSLRNTVIEREPGLIVWEFSGFFNGCDRWECNPMHNGTQLINRFEYSIPNPLIRWGFEKVARSWTQADMSAQLRRLKRVAEEIYRLRHQEK